MIILGLSCLAPSGVVHDVTAALVIDGKLRSAVSEDRFTKIKHYVGHPANAIKYCLDNEGIRFSDIDRIAVGYGLLNDVSDSSINRFFSHAKPLRLFRETPIRQKNPKFYNHEYIHAKTGYFFSGFKEAVVVSLDGGGVDDGNYVSGGIFVIKNGSAEMIRMYPLSASIGWAYGLFTEACGFMMVDGEGKTMSLAPYESKASPEIRQKIYTQVRQIFPKYEKIDYVGGGVEYPIFYTEHNMGFANIGDNRILSLVKSYTKELIAWASQKVLEETLVEIITSSVEHTGIKNVVLTGGVFFNMIANMKVREKLDKMNCSLFVNPICGDMGNAVGVAYEEYFQETGKYEGWDWPNLSLGPSFDDRQIESAIARGNLSYTKVDPVSTTVDLIDKGKIVGWFQGSAELGPRGLGNRSILSRPDDIKYKDIINEKVKHRESWRPFCPTITCEKSDYYLENYTYAPYMILGFRMKHSDEVPAISHIDNTTRPQTLSKDNNEMFYNVVKEGGGIVLNTSLNLAGDPIDVFPEDALMTFKNSKMDALVLGNYLIKR